MASETDLSPYRAVAGAVPPMGELCARAQTDVLADVRPNRGKAGPTEGLVLRMEPANSAFACLAQ